MSDTKNSVGIATRTLLAMICSISSCPKWAAGLPTAQGFLIFQLHTAQAQHAIGRRLKAAHLRGSHERPGLMVDVDDRQLVHQDRLGLVVEFLALFHVG